MENYVIELIGLAAGLTTLVSSVPQLVANLRDPESARKQSPMRNALQCVGNALWLLYGGAVGSLVMVVFSTMGCLMAACLLVQVLSVNPPWRPSFQA
ncbi:MAG: hypothetical protein AAF583_04810 [Pseudomonadota bacterium]